MIRIHHVPPDRGPKNYQRHKTRNIRVIRFYVVRWPQWIPAKLRASKTWFVVDQETGRIAKGSKPDGYSEKEDACEVAREYADKYGRFCSAPF